MYLHDDTVQPSYDDANAAELSVSSNGARVLWGHTVAQNHDNDDGWRY